MWKKQLRKVGTYIMKHSMVIFPILVVVSVAVTVAVALGAGKPDESEIEELLAVENVALISTDESEAESTEPEPDFEDLIENNELVRNDDGALYTLIATYYNALGTGDVETIQNLSNFVKDTEAVRITELSKYIESYPVIEIYTKRGPVENSLIAYVYTKVVFYGYDDEVPGFEGFYICTDENGSLYMNDGETSEEVLDFIRTVSLQEDVVELNNRVNAEYNELMTANEKLFEYISELEREVSIAAGEAIAAKVAEENQNLQDGSGEDDGQGTGTDGAALEGVTGTATTTVNVRVSDSELADRVGKLGSGNQVPVLELRQNGWAKVLFEGKESYVKAEYLLITGLEESGTSAVNEGESAGENTGENNGTDETAGGQQTLTRIAITNINLRKEASQSSEKLGTVVGGDKVEVLSESGEWSQIRYNGTIGYVKSEYLN